MLCRRFAKTFGDDRIGNALCCIIEALRREFEHYAVLLSPAKNLKQPEWDSLRSRGLTQIQSGDGIGNVIVLRAVLAECASTATCQRFAAMKASSLLAHLN